MILVFAPTLTESGALLASRTVYVSMFPSNNYVNW